MAKQHYYPIRDARDAQKVTLEPINEEVYQKIYPEIGRTQKQLQRAGMCFCPRGKLWVCDVDCALCNFSNAGNQVSIYAPDDDTAELAVEGLSIEDAIVDAAPSPEEVVMNQAVLSALYQELEKLHPRSRRICELIMEGKTKRESARIMGMTWIRYRKWYGKTMAALRANLDDYV